MRVFDLILQTISVDVMADMLDKLDIGDTPFCKATEAENGDIIVASINGESTVKRYKIFGESVFLMPENSAYEPIPIINTNELFIFGKVVEIRNRL